jgi:hypothetical protein
VTDANGEPPKPARLFERLGGDKGVRVIAHAWMLNIYADRTTSAFFSRFPREKLEGNAVVDLCEMSGGDDCGARPWSPPKSGRPNALTPKQWDALVMALKLAMEENKVGPDDQTDLLSVFGRERDEVVR